MVKLTKALGLDRKTAIQLCCAAQAKRENTLFSLLQPALLQGPIQLLQTVKVNDQGAASVFVSFQHYFCPQFFSECIFQMTRI